MMSPFASGSDSDADSASASASTSSSSSSLPAPAAHAQERPTRPLSPSPSPASSSAKGLGLGHGHGLGLGRPAPTGATARNRSPPSPLRYALGDPMAARPGIESEGESEAGKKCEAAGEASTAQRIGQAGKQERTGSASRDTVPGPVPVPRSVSGMASPSGPGMAAATSSVPRTPSGLALSALAQESGASPAAALAPAAAAEPRIHRVQGTTLRAAAPGLASNTSAAASASASRITATTATSTPLPAPRKPHFPHSRPLRPLTLSSALAPHAGTTSNKRPAAPQRQKLIVPSSGWKGCFTLNLTQAELARTD